MTGSSPRSHGAAPVGGAQEPPAERVPARPEAAVLAWLLPGLGHLYVGHRRRGVLILVATALLVAGGVLIGGPDVVDRRNDRLWFIAQAGCGPVVFVLDAFRERVSPAQSWDFSVRAGSDARQRYVDGDPELRRQLRRASIGHVNEIGTLYIALAGLMNLVVVLDFFNPHRVPSPRERAAREGGGA